MGPDLNAKLTGEGEGEGEGEEEEEEEVVEGDGVAEGILIKSINIKLRRTKAIKIKYRTECGDTGLKQVLRLHLEH